MSLASADLPSDPDALRAFALACQNELAAATAELQAAKLAVQLRTLEIEKLKLQIAKPLQRLLLDCPEGPSFAQRSPSDHTSQAGSDRTLTPGSRSSSLLCLLNKCKEP